MANEDSDRFQQKIVAVNKAGLCAVALAVVVGLSAGATGMLTREETVVVCIVLALVAMPVGYVVFLRAASAPSGSPGSSFSCGKCGQRFRLSEYSLTSSEQASLSVGVVPFPKPGMAFGFVCQGCDAQICAACRGEAGGQCSSCGAKDLQPCKLERVGPAGSASSIPAIADGNYFDEGQLSVRAIEEWSDERLEAELKRMKGREVSVLAFRQVPMAEAYADNVRGSLRHFGIESADGGKDAVVAIGKGRQLPFRVTIQAPAGVDERVRVEQELMPFEVVKRTLMGICQFLNAQKSSDADASG